jgi:hypothetical protein
MTTNCSNNLRGQSFTAALVCLFAVALADCTSMSDSMSSAFVDPAKYDLYNCVQLRTVRTANAKRMEELRGLMAKAETGAAGPVVAEVAYGNDYVAARAQSNLADEVWQRDHCDQENLPPEKPDPASAAKDVTAGSKRKPTGTR